MTKDDIFNGRTLFVASWVLSLILGCVMVKTFTGLVIFAILAIGVMILLRNYPLRMTTLMIPVFVALGVMGMRVINSYTFPNAKNHIYSNTDYHILEHVGFDYKDRVSLVDSQDSLYALWDGKQGKVTISNANENEVEVHIQDFYEPFYIKQDDRFNLVNNIYDLDVSKGFTVKEGENILMQLKISDFLANGKPMKGKSVYELGTGPNSMGPIEFNKALLIGYPFSDFILQSNLPDMDRLMDLFQDSYLIREAYSINPNSAASSSKLFFFPGKNFASEQGLSVSNDSGSIAANSGSASNLMMPYGTLFYVGLGKTATEKLLVEAPDSMAMKKGKRTIKFDFSQKFKLKDDTTNLMFVSSSLDEVIQNTLDGGYYFPLFEIPTNKNHCLGSIRYDKGDSNTAMSFQVNDQYNESIPSAEDTIDDGIIEVEADEEFLLSSKNKKHELTWRFQITNLRNSNALTNTRLYGFVICYIFLVILVISLIGRHNIHLIEVSTYVILFAFLMLRIILHWRISTFAPIEDISKYEYENTLRSDTWFKFTFGWMLIFFFVRMLIFYFKDKRFALNIDGKIKSLWQKVPFWSYILVYTGICLLSNAVSFFGSDTLERLLNIFLPISLYFLVIYLNLSMERIKLKPFNIEPFQAFNTLLIMGWMFIADSGFGIIFFLFVCLREALMALMERPTRRTRITALGFALLFLGIIFFGSKLISIAITNREVTYILICIIGFLVIGAILLAIHHLDNLKIHQHRRKLVFFASLALFATISVYGYVNDVQDGLSRFNYVKYRAQIHHTSIDELIQQEEFKSSEVSQILRAGQNQWFINAYLKKDQFAPKDAPKDYFSLKPHFNKGSGYTTQTRDVVVTRYVIAEHSEFVVLGLIFLVMGLLTFYILQYRHKGYNYMGLNAITLLFTIAFFVWLTATNRFIFFGQDFPFLSTTSKLTLYMPFLLLLIGVLSKKKEAPSDSAAMGPSKMKAVLYAVVVLLFVGVFLKIKNNIIAEERFNIGLTMIDMKERINLLNKHLKIYQYALADSESEYYDRDFDQDRIVEFYSNPTTLNGFIEGFNTYLNQEAQDDRISSGNISETPFANSVYRYFSEDLGDKRDQNEILHMIVKSEFLQLAINEQYYLIEPPAHKQNKWMGHLYAAQKKLSFKLENTNDDEEFITIDNDKFITDFDWMTEDKNIRNYQISVIPASWLMNNEMALLLRQKATNIEEERGKFRMLNNASTYTSFEQSYNSFALRFTPNDFINVYDPKNRVNQYKLVRNKDDYLMRNLWLNGKQRFFYPLGEDFIWAYNYANATRAKYSNTENVNDSVRVSIDYDLTKSLNGMIKDYAKRQKWNRQSFAVSILDGNGRIRAMVDYTKKKRLNPNDVKGLMKFRKESYAVQSPSAGREEKGNLNLFQVKIGPGSSVKPIMYAATTSQFNFDWSTLVLNELTQEISEEVLREEDEKLVAYGGKQITPWTLTNVDKLRSDNKFYLSKSSNTYHSLVMFLGSYNKSALQTNAEILRPFDRDTMRYPVFQHRNRTMTFNPDNWPRSKEGDSDFFGNTNSILAKGLETNFDLNVSWPKEIRRVNYVDFDPAGNTSVFNDNETEFKTFSYPEKSSFIHDNREQGRGFGRSLKQSTLGGSPIVITPLKMAEMGGRLLSMNRNFDITLDDTESTKEYIPFDIDEASWRSSENYFESFYKPYLLNSLEQVIGPSGTLNNTRIKTLRRNSKYFYYAKTGTINFETRRGNRQSDKLLLFMISEKDIDDLDYKSLGTNKFYSLYFACYECSSLPYELLESIIEKVETNNVSFEKYFNTTPTELND